MSTKHSNEEHGVAVMEFLLVAPLLFIIIFSTINFCFAAYNQWYLVSTVLPEVAVNADDTNSLGELRYRAAELLMKGGYKLTSASFDFSADSNTKILTLSIIVFYEFLIPFPGWTGLTLTETVYTKYTE